MDIVQNVNATTTSVDAELQVRNVLDHKRVYAPSTDKLLSDVLKELKKISNQLSFITDEEL